MTSANAGSLGDLQRAFQDYLLARQRKLCCRRARHQEGRPVPFCSASIATPMRCA